MALLSGPAEADNRLSFSGTRVGRSETAPLLKICLARNVARDVDSGRAIDPTIRVEFLGSAANSAPQASHDHAALELATKWGAVADCVYRSNFSRLCDIDNRALAVQAANTFVVKADEIASTPDSYSATQPEVESLAQVKSRVLDSLQYLIKSGVLIASDFTMFAPASVRQALAKPIPSKMPAPSNSTHAVWCVTVPARRCAWNDWEKSSMAVAISGLAISSPISPLGSHRS
jgi:hypothetical protein